MVTIVGSTNLDQIGRVAHLPNPGETILCRSFATTGGGKGANQALAARLAGANVRHVSAVGSDLFADEALSLLETAGVDLSHVMRVPGPTGLALILVDGAGENTIAVLAGANAALSTGQIDAALADIAPGSVVMAQQEIPQEATIRALAIARQKGAIGILNVAPMLDDTASAASEAAIVIANESEFAVLCGGEAGPLEAVMREWAARRQQTLIVTLGEKGAVAATPTGVIIHVPALAVEPVDTVGAGDTFCGYFAAALEAGLNLEQALRRAVVAASLACQNEGAQPSIPYAQQVDPAQPA